MPVHVPDEIKKKFFNQGKHFVTKVDTETIRSLESWIMQNRIGEKPKDSFTIVINSSGGSPSWILDFASFVRTLSPEVNIKGVAFGECGSAALALLQCCHERIAVKYTGFFIHHINKTLEFGCHVQDLSKIKRKIKKELGHSKKVEDELIELQTKRTGLSRKKWLALADAGEEIPGRVITTREAKKLGLIDEIVDSYPIF